jgi:hypothetical protein
MAGREGFEPPVGCPTLVFKTRAINRSTICPLIRSISKNNCQLIFLKTAEHNELYHSISQNKGALL